MRCCKKCSEIKKYEDFGKDKSKKDGISIYCKKCNASKTLNSKKDKEKIKNYNKEYRLNNESKLKDYHSNYYLDNIDIIKNRSSLYCKTDNCKEYKKKYRFENREKNSEYGVIYRELKKEDLREYFRVYRSDKRSTDILYRLKDQIRHRISESLKSIGSKKNNTTINIIGCSIEYLKLYLESKFEPWMTWENYGKYNGQFNYGWDIDHKIPLSSGKTEEKIIELNYYTNLQPLCSYVNRYIKIDNIYETY
jgi:hypothetical protein